MALEGQLKKAIEEAGFSFLEISGFMSRPKLALLAGAAIGGIGSSMTGSLAGIGGATQSMVGVGLFSHAAGMAKGMFRW